MPCLCATTRLAARTLTRFYEAELRQAGLLAAQFWLLWTLSVREQTPQHFLSADMAMDQTTLSRNLALLVRKGWVKNEAVGRERFYSLTQAGRNMLKHAQPYWKRAQTKMQEALGAEWDGVLQALQTITRAAEAFDRDELVGHAATPKAKSPKPSGSKKEKANART